MAESIFSFVGAVELLKNIGLFDIILPIILTYAIVFGILQRANIFQKEGGKTNKELNASIALIIALLLVGAANITGLIQKFMPFVGLISILLVTLLMLIGLLSGEKEKLIERKETQVVLAVIAAIAFIFTFGMVAGWWELSTVQGLVLSGQGLFSTENLSVILFILLLAGVVVVITNSVSGPKEKPK